MYDWDRLRVFHAVAQAQSLTKAGEVMNLSQSAISRQISGLEEQMGVTLFHRHARGLLLTEQGEILYRSVAEISHKLKATETALMDSRERPKGPLVVTAPVAMGTRWLIPQLAEFSELYPEIELSLIASDEDVDVAMREADCAIRPYEAKQPDVIQRKVAVIHNDLYASNDYLRKHGVIKKPEDLQHHSLIAYGEFQRPPFADVDWLLKLGDGRFPLKPAFRVNSLLGMLRAVENGMGIAGLPDYVTKEVKNITRLLPDVKGPPIDLYFIYPSELRYSKRITIFRDFILRKLGEVKF